MTRYVFTYGLIAGLAIIGTIILGNWFEDGGTVLGSEFAGYLIMLVALSLIFVATKRYRDRDLGGVIRFGRAFGLGVAISAIAGVAYVAVWEIYLAATDYAFIDQYTSGVIAAERDAGASDADLAALGERMAAMQETYSKPWLRIPITFSEIFPVGALVSLISALVLRRRQALPA